MARDGSARIHSKMAWSFCSSGRLLGTMASEKPSRYLRTEYSRNPVYIEDTTAMASNRFTPRHTARKISGLFAGNPITPMLRILHCHVWPLQACYREFPCHQQALRNPVASSPHCILQPDARTNLDRKSQSGSPHPTPALRAAPPTPPRSPIAVR